MGWCSAGMGQCTAGLQLQLGPPTGANIARPGCPCPALPPATPQDQIITAEPDVRSADIKPEDRFLVLACDGG